MKIKLSIIIPVYKAKDTLPRAINSINNQNIKFDNFKIVVSNNKIILTFVALFILFVSYLLVPTVYKQGEISKELKNELLSKFNLDFTFTQNIN